MKRVILNSLLLGIALGSVAHADTTQQRFSSADSRVTLLELFTSEGCSSCPPAVRWLSDLKTDGRLWREVLPVAFHVDYWDYIGWRDRFANADYSQRQRRYAVEGNLRSVYTPGVLKGGEEWRGWWRKPLPREAAPPAGNLVIEVDDSSVSVAYRATDGDPQNLDVHVALLGMDLQTEVAAGENEGRTLAHDFVVLGLTSAPLTTVGRRYAADLTLPDPVARAPRYALAAWVSAAGKQAPVQALGGYLDFSPVD